MVQRQDGGDGVSIGKKHLPAVESLVAPPDPFECDRCGEPRANHHTAITAIYESPFNPTKTEYVLMCPSATFKAKE